MVTKKHVIYNVVIADEEDLDGTIDVIKEDIREELVVDDKENSIISDKKKT
jgi:hypothetical protein